MKESQAPEMPAAAYLFGEDNLMTNPARDMYVTPKAFAKGPNGLHPEPVPLLTGFHPVWYTVRRDCAIFF
jgi:hypothetical protein